jgi:hypothetical protein
MVCCGYKPLAEILTQLSKKKTAAKKGKGLLFCDKLKIEF